MLVIAQVTKLLRKYLAAGRLQAATKTSAGTREQHDVLTQHTQPAVAAMENEALGARLRGGGMSRSGGGDGGARRRGGPRTKERERERERKGQRERASVLYLCNKCIYHIFIYIYIGRSSQSLSTLNPRP
jgi:hypothetical protein